jgi:hypothetical protein
VSLEELLREAPGSTAEFKKRMSRPKIQMFDEIGNGSILVVTLPVLFGSEPVIESTRLFVR